MNYFKKIERGLTALALIPLSSLETREKRRRLDERLMRLEQKQERLRSTNLKLYRKKEYS
jgi:hypothetical protein